MFVCNHCSISSACFSHFYESSLNIPWVDSYTGLFHLTLLLGFIYVSKECVSTSFLLINMAPCEYDYFVYVLISWCPRGCFPRFSLSSVVSTCVWLFRRCVFSFLWEWNCWVTGFLCAKLCETLPNFSREFGHLKNSPYRAWCLLQFLFSLPGKYEEASPWLLSFLFVSYWGLNPGLFFWSFQIGFLCVPLAILGLAL